MNFKPGDKVWVKRTFDLWWPALVVVNEECPQKRRVSSSTTSVIVQYPAEDKLARFDSCKDVKVFDCKEAGDFENKARNLSRTRKCNFVPFAQALSHLLSHTPPSDTAAIHAADNSHHVDTAANITPHSTATDTELGVGNSQPSDNAPAVIRAARKRHCSDAKQTVDGVSMDQSPKILPRRWITRNLKKACSDLFDKKIHSSSSQTYKSSTETFEVTLDAEMDKKSQTAEFPYVPCGVMKRTLALLSEELPDITPPKRLRSRTCSSHLRRSEAVAASERCRRSLPVVESAVSSAVRDDNMAISTADGDATTERSKLDPGTESTESAASVDTGDQVPLPMSSYDRLVVTTSVVKQSGCSASSLFDTPEMCLSLKNSDACSNGKSSTDMMSGDDRLVNSESESDDGDELPVFNSQSPYKQTDVSFNKGDIVWAKWPRHPFWPAVVKNVYKKRARLQRLSVFFIGTDFKLKQSGFVMKYHASKVKHYCKDEETAAFYNCSDAGLNEVVKKVDEYYCKKAIGKTQKSALDYFKVDCDDDNVSDTSSCYAQESSPLTNNDSGLLTQRMTSDDDVSSESEEENNNAAPDAMPKIVEDRMRRSSQRTRLLTDRVKTPDCKAFLVKIMRGDAPSERHERFHQRLQEQRQQAAVLSTTATAPIYLGCFGPIEDDDQIYEIFGCLMSICEEQNYLTVMQRPQYVQYVMAPEAIVYAIRRVHHYAKKRAWQVFGRGPRQTKAEVKFHHEHILASAEKIDEADRQRYKAAAERNCQRFLNL